MDSILQIQITQSDGFTTSTYEDFKKRLDALTASEIESRKAEQDLAHKIDVAKANVGTKDVQNSDRLLSVDQKLKDLSSQN